MEEQLNECANHAHLIYSPIENVIDHEVSYSELILPQIDFGVFAEDGKLRDEIHNIGQKQHVN
jgi:hypothetical protein